MFSNQEQHHTHSQNNLPHPQGGKKKKNETLHYTVLY